MIATRMAPAEGMAGELVAHVLDELPTLTVLDDDRDRLLAAAWLASLRSARTRSAYAGDLLACRAWLTGRGLKLLVAGWVPDVSRSSNRCLAPAVRACEDRWTTGRRTPGVVSIKRGPTRRAMIGKGRWRRLALARKDMWP